MKHFEELAIALVILATVFLSTNVPIAAAQVVPVPDNVITGATIYGQCWKYSLSPTNASVLVYDSPFRTNCSGYAFNGASYNGIPAPFGTSQIDINLGKWCTAESNLHGNCKFTITMSNPYGINALLVGTALCAGFTIEHIANNQTDNSLAGTNQTIVLNVTCNPELYWEQMTGQ